MDAKQRRDGKVFSTAGRVLRDPTASDNAKSVAGSALAQSATVTDAAERVNEIKRRVTLIDEDAARNHWVHFDGAAVCGDTPEQAIDAVIRQAEQAARQDERRKVLEEAARVCDDKIGPMPKDSWTGQMVKRMFKEAAASIRALAEEVT